jgi:hypothetical protein
LKNFALRILRVGRMARDSKRRSIVRELIETERNYVNSLLICEEVYYNPLNQSITSKSPLIDAATLAQLFGNLDEIRATHQVILREMDTAVEALKRHFPPRSSYLRVVAPFGEVISRMNQLYTRYLASNEQAEEILKRLKKNKIFRTFLCESLFNPRAKCQEIEDLLILPTQRVAGYKMLFERVMRYFPQETFGPIQEAYQSTLDALLRLGAMMNQEKAEIGSQEKLLTIAETVLKIPPVMCILKPGRKYVGFEELVMADAPGKPSRVFGIYITSDILILAQQLDAKRAKWVYVDAIPITQVRFSVSQDQANIELAFNLLSDTETYCFIMKSTEKRDQFITSIKQMKKAIKEHVARQTALGAEYMQGVLGKITSMYESPPPPTSRQDALDSIK